MKVEAVWIALATATVALAGCAGGSGDEDALGVEEVDIEEVELATGKGAIEGLLVDDRFRPIEGGTILLQPIALKATSNADGEFNFLDVDPGAYTIKTSAEGHEASPQTVNVAEGEFAEANVVARRVVSEGGSIITEEYSAFASCQVSVPAATANCGAFGFPPDLSGETERNTFYTNYTSYGNVSYVVFEMKSNKEASRDGALKLVVRDEITDVYMVNDVITEGDYLKTWMKKGDKSPHDVEDRNGNWTNENGQLLQLWAQGNFKEETQAIFGATCTAGFFCTADSRGIGLQNGVRVQFIASIFLGEPEVDIESYCVLC